jgi:hypothetical protein
MNRPPSCVALTALIATTALLALAGNAAAAETPSPAQSHLGINLAGPADWCTEHPFVDVFRYSRQWISQRKGEPWGKGPPLARDENGWVTRLEDDCWAETPILTGGAAPVGEYVCLYDGDGQVEFNHNARVVSRRPGRIVVHLDVAKSGTFLSVRRTDPADPVRNIRVIMPGHEKSYQAEPFSPAFLKRWNAMNTYRFMDWMHTNGSKQQRWADRPTPTYCTYTDRGVPVEVMVDLCNRQKINPWFCMPHLADDDYVRNFAEVVKAKLDPSLIVYVEYSNEIWNSMFAQTRYANEQGQKLGFGERPWEAGWRYSSYRSAQMHRIWEEVFGGPQRLVRVIASQCVGAVSKGKLEFQDNYKRFDALAIAPYMGFNVPPTSEKGRLGADEVSQWSVEKVLDHVESEILPKTIKSIDEQKQIADQFKVKLIAYEAGQHLVGVAGGENNDALTELFHAANRHPRMGGIYKQYLDGWKQSGGQLCAIFSSVGRYSKWGSWGLLESGDQAGSPKLDAVMQWNHANAK